MKFVLEGLTVCVLGVCLDDCPDPLPHLPCRWLHAGAPTSHCVCMPTQVLPL